MNAGAIELARPSPGRRAAGRADLRTAALARAYPGPQGAELLRAMIEVELPGRIAVASSFGAEAAVLLALVADIDRAVPVVALDTGKLFDETLAYVRWLTDWVGLSDVRLVRPDPARIAAADPGGTLWSYDPEACCALRKIEPLCAALAPFEAWVSGRKRLHGEARSAIPTRVPLAITRWSARWRTPCATTSTGRSPNAACRTTRRSPRATPRTAAGRARAPSRRTLAGTEKTECGIHRPALF